MAIQEFDLTIKHRSGKSNTHADALSRNPVRTPAESSARSVTCTEQEEQLQLKELMEHQEKDEHLKPIFIYLKTGALPANEALAKKVVLESSQYDIISGILHHEDPNHFGNWRVVVPEDMRERLLKELHGGKFSGHFAWKKLYKTMRKKYWWRGMCGAVERHCKSCLECVTRKGSGRAVKPPLVPIPVGGPFHRMGVDILQLPLTESGNRYVVIFMDYVPH